MSSMLIPLLQRSLEAAGWASIRFNFRGNGRSEGRFERGVGEQRDVAAALEAIAAEAQTGSLAVVGWSFGAMVGLMGATADARVGTFAAIAPPVSVAHEAYPEPGPERLAAFRARVLAVCGTADEICRPDDMERWARAITSDPDVRVIDGADHLFSEHRDELVAAVTSFVVP